MTLAWQTELRHTEKLVLLALADNANDEGRCFPSVATLMAKCGMTDRGVQRIIARLGELGHLDCHYRTGKSTVYTVHPRTAVTPEPQSPPNRSHHTPDPGSPPPPTGATKTPDPGSPIISKKPPVEPPSNRQGVAQAARKHPRAQSEEPPPSNLNVEAWHRWVQYREQIRKALKSVSIPAAQRKLAAFELDQGAVVEQSIANGWTGLFALQAAKGAKPEPIRTWEPPEDEHATV